MTGFDVSADNRRVLLDVATHAIERVLDTGKPELPSPDYFSRELSEPRATFVTLEDPREELLGCIGSIEARNPLVVDVAKNAMLAAFEDPRTGGVGLAEFVEMSVKISVLSPLEPVHAGSFEELAGSVRPGIDGLLLDAGSHHSTLLPSVWPKVPDVDEFLRILWLKAGLTPRKWLRGTAIRRYTTVEFGDPGPRAPAGSGARR